MISQNKSSTKNLVLDKNKIIVMVVLLGLIFGWQQGTWAQQTVDQDLAKIKSDLEQRQKRIDELDKQRQIYEKSLQEKRKGVVTLKNQLGILDDNIQKLTLDLNTTELQTEQTNLEISDTQLKIGMKGKEIERQQQRMSKIVEALNHNDQRKLQIFMVLLRGSLGQFFQEINQLQAVEQSLTLELKQLRQLKIQMEQQHSSLEDKHQRLTILQNQLADNQDRLDAEKKGKQELLVATKGQEDKFQKMLEENRAEQTQINAEIQNLAVLIKNKLAAQAGGGFANISDKGFAWPTNSRRISTYFHDPDYPFRHIFEHPAIDVAGVPQGTPIRAAAGGYVGKVKNGGLRGYSYILLVHKDGLATVYGHLSKMYAQEDTYVSQGEIIGLSGGTPGTPGAGSLTTGPHLHFEVRKDGIPNDPLIYLPK
ncbi:MAG: peptidoglycan DD-metalloendopeptidase family protein [Candidatus Komeilibacteria bacterium]|nr:peptidoglycan DD-metalloendopeptidase family protein [Candidatus Komeilibacteria bacterium]